MEPIYEELDSEKFTKFKLGVYNLAPFTYDENVMITVDPLCLATLLFISKKTQTKLPRLGPQQNGTSKLDGMNCIVALSHEAAPDKQLPLLIEDDINRKTKKVKRKVRTTAVINKFIEANVTNPIEQMYNKLVDTRLFDFYVAALVSTGNVNLIMRLYSLAGLEATQKTIFDKLMFPSICNNLVSRNGFNLRNKHIAQSFARNNFSSLVKPKWFDSSVIEEYARCNKEGHATIKKFELLCKENSGGPILKGKKATIVDFKIASLVYCIFTLAEFVPDFQKVSLECPTLKMHCDSIMKDMITN